MLNMSKIELAEFNRNAAGIGRVLSGIADYQTSVASSRSDRYYAEMLLTSAETVYEIGSRDAKKRRDESMSVVGAQAVFFSQSGVTSEGSPAAKMLETVKKISYDYHREMVSVLSKKYQSALNARKTMNDAELSKDNARTQMFSSIASAMASFGGGGG